MRLLAIGDIHGCAVALETLLHHIDLCPGDKVITLGDYLNKGPDTKKTLDILIHLHAQGSLVPLLGNHEFKLMKARQKGRTRIGSTVLVDRQTLASYQRDLLSKQKLIVQDLECIPDAHWQFVQKHCQRWFETENHIFVHATLEPTKPLSEQSDTVLFWNKLYKPQPHQSGKVVICGHTPQKDGKPLNFGHTICLDTAAWQGRWLTCLEVYSGNVWQANQAGEIRFSNIEDYRFSTKLPKQIRYLVSYFT